MSVQAIKSAFEASPSTAMLEYAEQAYARWGAARIYIVIVEKAAAKLVKKAGFKLGPAYGVTESPVAYYAGYQHFEPRIAAKAMAIAAALKEAGINCYVDGQGD